MFFSYYVFSKFYNMDVNSLGICNGGAMVHIIGT